MEKLSKEKGKNLINNACELQNNLYKEKDTNIANKLTGSFTTAFNTFFTRFSSVYIAKVINFVPYQQPVYDMLHNAGYQMKMMLIRNG